MVLTVGYFKITSIDFFCSSLNCIQLTRETCLNNINQMAIKTEIGIYATKLIALWLPPFASVRFINNEKNRCFLPWITVFIGFWTMSRVMCNNKCLRLNGMNGKKGMIEEQAGFFCSWVGFALLLLRHCIPCEIACLIKINRDCYRRLRAKVNILSLWKLYSPAKLLGWKRTFRS